MFATQTMLASTILTDAILFKHEEQEKNKAMSAKTIRLDFQVSDHKKFSITRIKKLRLELEGEKAIMMMTPNN